MPTDIYYYCLTGSYLNFKVSVFLLLSQSREQWRLDSAVGAQFYCYTYTIRKLKASKRVKTRKLIELICMTGIAACGKKHFSHIELNNIICVLCIGES